MTSTEQPTEQQVVDPQELNGQRFQPVVALIGAIVIGLGLSGLIDDSGLIEHPWWVVLVLAAVVISVFVIARTVSSLAG